jgi:hypothetical protein
MAATLIELQHIQCCLISFNSLDSIWDPYWKHEFYDDDDQEEEPHPINHVNFVLDLLKPLDEKIQIKVSRKQGIRLNY